MTFDEVLDQVLALLQREKRLSYRALKVRFGLDDEHLAALKDEIIEAKQLAEDDRGVVLVWTGTGDPAPPASASTPARASFAAMRAYTEDVRRAYGLEMRIRVGLNSGEVVVRAIGNDLHMDYSAVGETTHLAARMEQMALPGTIRLTAATLRLVEGLVQISALGPVPVKGLVEPIEVFELTGASRLRRRLQAAAARGL